ncbi:MAG: urease accessory protein UreF [Chloroflexota bacterium]
MAGLTLDMGQALALLHLTDSSFPTGAFSHSYGLETYTQAGIVHDAETLMAFITGRLLDGMARFDLVLLREAMHADLETVQLLDAQLTAMLPVYEVREASMQVGRRFLKAALPLYGGERSGQYVARIQAKQVRGHFVLAYGVIAGELEIEAETALLAYAHTFVMGQAAAAVKLINMGQTRTQAVIRQMQPVMQNAVAHALSCTLEDIHTFTPAYDIRAMQHEYLFRRLFIS